MSSVDDSTQQKPKQLDPSDEDNPRNRHSKQSQLKQTLTGATSACITRFITQPFDVVKIRFQLQAGPIRSPKTGEIIVNNKYTSVFQSFRLIYLEEGRCALWKGHTAGQLISISNGLVHFWCFEQCRYFLRKVPSLQSHNNLTNFISGTMSGCLGTTAGMPFDVIRTRLVAQDPNTKSANTFQSFRDIIRKDGAFGLYRGLTINLVQVCPMMGSNFMIYHICTKFGKRVLQPPDNILPAWWLLFSGATSGVVSKFLVYPLDFIKKRMQLRDFQKDRKTFGRNLTCNGFFDCIRVTMKEEGFLAFYKGTMPTMIKSACTTGIYFSMYDELMMFLNRFN